jgi:hypothetical protein
MRPARLVCGRILVAQHLHLFNLADKTALGKCCREVNSSLSLDQVRNWQRVTCAKKLSSLIHFAPTRCKKATEPLPDVADFHEPGFA